MGQLEDFQEADEPSFANEDAAAVHQALSQIGIKHREVLVLHFLEDLSVAEIAEVVGLHRRDCEVPYPLRQKSNAGDSERSESWNNKMTHCASACCHAFRSRRILLAFREETAALLAKHEKALFTEKMAVLSVFMSAFAIDLAELFWGPKARCECDPVPLVLGGLLFFVGAVSDLERYRICRSKVDLLKEVKQVQLQMPRTSGFAAKGSLTSVLIAQKPAFVTARLEVPLIDAARAAGRQKQILHSAYPMDTGVHGAPKRSVQDDTVVDVCGFPPLTR